MPRKKELPAPDSGEQDDLLSAETQEFPDAPLTEPVVEPIPTESPPDEGAPEDDTPSEEYTEFLQALNEAPAQEDPQPAPSDEAEPMPSEEEPALTIPAEEPSGEAALSESPPAARNDAVLTITARTRIKSEAEATDELWHEIRNAYRTRRILTGTLDGIEQTAGGKTLATVSFRGFRIAIPIREMLVLEERMPSGRAYADYMNRLNRILGTMLGAEIDFIVKGIDSTTHSAVNTAQRIDHALMQEVAPRQHAQRRCQPPGSHAPQAADVLSRQGHHRESLHLSRPSGRSARDRRRGKGAARRSLWH